MCIAGYDPNFQSFYWDFNLKKEENMAMCENYQFCACLYAISIQISNQEPENYLEAINHLAQEQEKGNKRLVRSEETPAWEI